MRRPVVALALALVPLLVGFAAVSPARAATTITSATIDNGYPKTLTFKVSARSDSDITDVTLAYAITGRGTSALGKPSEFTAGKSVDAKVEVQTQGSQGYIPVGSEFVYHWEITAADGTVTKSDEARFLFLPPGKDWKTVKNDFMTVYYGGADREALATAYLKSGEQTYDKIGKQLLNVTLKQLPVRVILFDTEKELETARISEGRRDEVVTNCGVKVANDIVFVIPVSCGTPDRTDTLRHEFGHIINDAAGNGVLAKLNSWIDEGTAVYAQSQPGSGYTGAVEAAIRSDRLIPFAQMGTPAADPRLVDLFYGQSYTMVKYLIDKGGPAKYAEFFATIKKGNRFDQALKIVYGFDVDGFEQEFRQANKLGPSVQPTAVPTRPAQQTQPTATATTRPQQAQPTATPRNDAPAGTTTTSSGGGNNKTVIIGAIGGAVLFALLGVFAFLISQMMASGRRTITVDAPPPSDPEKWKKPEE